MSQTGYLDGIIARWRAVCQSCHSQLLLLPRWCCWQGFTSMFPLTIVTGKIFLR